MLETDDQKGPGYGATGFAHASHSPAKTGRDFHTAVFIEIESLSIRGEYGLRAVKTAFETRYRSFDFAHGG